MGMQIPVPIGMCFTCYSQTDLFNRTPSLLRCLGLRHRQARGGCIESSDGDVYFTWVSTICALR